MKFFRSVCIIFAFGVFAFGSFFLNFMIIPFAKVLLSCEDYINFSSNIIHKTWRFFVSFLEFIKLIKVCVKNEDIRNIQNKIIVSTHPSFIDIVILIALIPKTTCFVKNKLTKNFLLKNIVNSIFIPNDIDIEELKIQTKKYLDLGFNIVIFPMGTRHRKDEHPKIKKGASLVALNANKDIVPVRMDTSCDFLFINRPFYEAGEKQVDFNVELGELIEIKNFENESEIITKRKICEEISKALYG